MAQGSPRWLGLDPKKNSYSLDGSKKGLLILGREGDGSVFISHDNVGDNEQCECDHQHRQRLSDSKRQDTPDILGSMEFTTKLAGARVVLVMGHSACGAVAGAIADAKLGNLTQLLAKIQPAIKATKYTGDRTAGNAEFVDAVARTNVNLTMANIRKNSKVIAALEKAGAVKIAGAFYDLKTGAVEFFA